MLHRTPRARTNDQAGFTLIELLVVIIILGILAAVVVFAVRGSNDKGAAAAHATDAKTVRTAQEAFFAKFGRYGTLDELVNPPDGSPGFLSEASTLTGVKLDGDATPPTYTLTCDVAKAGCGSGGALPKGAGYWSSTGSMTTPRYDSINIGLPNGKVMAAGGRSNVAPLVGFNTVELWDPLTGRWTATAPMSVSRWSGTGTVLPNGKVLVAGGFREMSLATNGTAANGQSVNDSAELYDPATNTWSAAATMGFRRALHSAVLLPSGKVLVTGGRTCSAPFPTACNSSFVTNTAEVYDPAANTWTRTANNIGNLADNPNPGIPATNATAATTPQAGRHTTQAAVLTTNCGTNCGKVVVPAGFTGISQTTADVYDPATNSWSANRPTLVVAGGRARSGAMPLPNGKILVAAGGTGQSSATSELFDPVTLTFALTGSVAITRFNYFWKVLPDGTALIAGGSNAGIQNAELYDPATGLWKSAGNLRVPQGSTSSNANSTEAVLLTTGCGTHCGKVMIIGQSPTGAAQLYQPGG